MPAWTRAPLFGPVVRLRGPALPPVLADEAVARLRAPPIRRLGETTPPLPARRDDGRKQHPASVKRIAGLFPAPHRPTVKTRENGRERIELAR